MPMVLPMRFMDSQTANARKPHPGVEEGHGTLFVGSKGWGESCSRWPEGVPRGTCIEVGTNTGEKAIGKVSEDQIQKLY